MAFYWVCELSVAAQSAHPNPPSPRNLAQRPTVDEILRMPEVRSKVQYLPLELQRLADEQQVCCEQEYGWGRVLLGFAVQGAPGAAAPGRRAAGAPGFPQQRRVTRRDISAAPGAAAHSGCAAGVSCTGMRAGEGRALLGLACARCRRIAVCCRTPLRSSPIIAAAHPSPLMQRPDDPIKLEQALGQVGDRPMWRQWERLEAKLLLQAAAANSPAVGRPCCLVGEAEIPRSVWMLPRQPAPRKRRSSTHPLPCITLAAAR